MVLPGGARGARPPNAGRSVSRFSRRARYEPSWRAGPWGGAVLARPP